MQWQNSGAQEKNKSGKKCITWVGKIPQPHKCTLAPRERRAHRPRSSQGSYLGEMNYLASCLGVDPQLWPYGHSDDWYCKITISGTHACQEGSNPLTRQCTYFLFLLPGEPPQKFKLIPQFPLSSWNWKHNRSPGRKNIWKLPIVLNSMAKLAWVWLLLISISQPAQSDEENASQNWLNPNGHDENFKDIYTIGDPVTIRWTGWDSAYTDYYMDSKTIANLYLTSWNSSDYSYSRILACTLYPSHILLNDELTILRNSHG